MYSRDHQVSSFVKKLSKSDGDSVTNGSWLQLSGHNETFVVASGSKSVWKKRSGDEATIYKLIQRDSLIELVPKFYGEVEHNGEWFIKLEDLLHHFKNPSVMDVKMGIRTFLEAEVTNPNLREDLYEKMVKIDTNEPSAEEHRAKAVTKLHYMEFREKQSSSSDLGFRIEAVKLAGKKLENELQKVRQSDDIAKTLANFVCHNSEVCENLLIKLQSMRELLTVSKLFNHLEMIGSSLLILYDSNAQVGVWMIDFAKTVFLDKQTLTHIQPWTLGNREDGYLFGLDNFIQICKRVADNLRDNNHFQIMPYAV